MRQRLKSWLNRGIVKADDRLVDVAEEAIRKANRGEWLDKLEIPKPYTMMGKNEASVANIIIGMQIRRYVDR